MNAVQVKAHLVTDMLEYVRAMKEGLSMTPKNSCSNHLRRLQISIPLRDANL